MKNTTSDQLPSGWAKCPSVFREGKYFYRHLALRATVRQSPLSGDWEVQIDGQSPHFGFASYRAAMADLAPVKE